MVQTVEKINQRRVRHLQPHEGGGGVFHVLRLVEHHRIERGQHTAAVREVGEEQVVVDDEQVRPEPLPPFLEIKTLPVGGAVFSQTLVFLPPHLLPHRRQHFKGQIAAQAGFGFGGPVEDRLHLGVLRRPGEQAGLGGPLHPPQGQVVFIPQAEGMVEGHPQPLFEEGNVVVHDLLLQGFGVGGNDDFFFVGHRPQDGGNEVGEAFSGAGSGFDDQGVPLPQRALHGAGHLHLLWPVFEAVHAFGQQAIGLQIGCRFRQRHEGLMLRSQRRGDKQILRPLSPGPGD